MNWQQIKTDYLYAFNKLQREYSNYSFENFTGWAAIIDQVEHREFPVRLLYDFFDKHYIFVSVYKKLETECIYKFYITIHNRKHIYIKDLQPALIGRIEAEVQAFYEAFRLLNDQIREGIVKP